MDIPTLLRFPWSFHCILSNIGGKIFFLGGTFWKNIKKNNLGAKNEFFIFGPAFSLISENLVEQFFLKFWKTLILGQNGHFSAHLAKIGQNENFYQKSGRAIFLPLLSRNFMPSFRKIVGAVSEINSLRTDGRTHKSDITEPFAFAGSLN